MNTPLFVINMVIIWYVFTGFMIAFLLMLLEMKEFRTFTNGYQLDKVFAYYMITIFFWPAIFIKLF